MADPSAAGWYQWDGDDLLVRVKTQPRASRDEIVGPYGDSLKIRITAPPVDGKANAHLLRFVAACFGVSPTAVELIAGASGRDKRLRIHRPSIFPLPLAIHPRL